MGLLASSNVLLLCNPETLPKNLINFLTQKVNKLTTLHQFQECTTKLHSTDVIILKQFGNYEAILTFIQETKTNYKNMQFLIIDNVQAQSYYQNSQAIFLPLPLENESFIDALSQTTKRSFEYKHSTKLDPETFESIIDVQENLFILLQNKTPKYVSKPFLKFFNVLSQEQFFESLEKRARNTSTNIAESPITAILDKTYEHESYTLTDSGENLRRFKIQIAKFAHKKFDTILTFHEEHTLQNQMVHHHTLVTKLEFYEKLKNALLDESNDLTLCSIKFLNYEKTLQNHGMEKAFACVNELVNIISSFKETLALSHWKEDNLIFMTSKNFEESKHFISAIRKKIFNYTFTDELHVSILASCVTVDKRLDFSKSLEQIEQLQEPQVHEHIHTVLSYEDISDEHKRVLVMLKDFYEHSKEYDNIKLLNFYKGLAIRNEMDLIQVQKDSILVRTQKTQYIAMNNEKKVILQSAFFNKDIVAEVLSIDIIDNFAELGNFKLLHASPQERKFARVQPKTKMPCTISSRDFSVSGTVFDLSANSLSVLSTKISDKLEPQHAVNVIINMIDVIRNISMPIHCSGRVVHIVKSNEKYKIIVNLQILDEENNNIILEYVYNRQKELILELKSLLRTL